MKTMPLARATAPLAEYAGRLNGSPLVVTDGGKPVAVLVPVNGMDLESLALSTDRQFLDLIERSRKRQAAEGGLSAEEVRRRLKGKAAASRPRNLKGPRPRKRK